MNVLLYLLCFFVYNTCHHGYLLVLWFSYVPWQIQHPWISDFHPLFTQWTFPNPSLPLRSRLVPNSLMKSFPSTAASAKQPLPCVSTPRTPCCPFQMCWLLLPTQSYTFATSVLTQCRRQKPNGRQNIHLKKSQCLVYLNIHKNFMTTPTYIMR